QLSAVKVTPAEANSPRYSSRASLPALSCSIGRGTGGRKPPELISALSRPSSRSVWMASATGLSCRQAVVAPSFRGEPSSLSVDDHFGAAVLGRGGDRVQQADVAQALGEGGDTGEPVQPGDLPQHRAGLA